MKFILNLLLVGTLLIAASCVKKKNCDCNISGTWMYLDEPYYIKTPCDDNVKIVAHFCPDDTLIDPNDPWKDVAGKVPKEFRTSTPIRVNVCFEFYCSGLQPAIYSNPAILQCIEREE